MATFVEFRREIYQGLYSASTKGDALEEVIQTARVWLVNRYIERAPDAQMPEGWF